MRIKATEKAWRENLKYNLQAMRVSVSLIFRSMFGKERKKWRIFLRHKFAQYKKEEILCKHQRSILLLINAGEILGTTIFCNTLRRLYPHHNLLIAVDNHDAYTIGKKLGIADVLVYTPWDFAWIGKKMANKFGLDLGVFLMKIFHPVVGKTWKESGICVGMISGYFSDQLATHPTNISLWKRLSANHAYEMLDFISMQTEEQKKDVKKYIERTDLHMLGNIREDTSHVRATNYEKKMFYAMMHCTPKDRIIIAAATRDDEEIILDAYQQVQKKLPGTTLILIPRYPEHAEKIKKQVEEKGVPCVLFSKMKERGEIIIGDQLIELGKLYSIAKIVIFARTFFRIGGWANILEPAYHGKPVIFGSELKLWPKGLGELVRTYPEVQVNNSTSLANSILYFMSHSEEAQKVGKAFHALTKEGKATAIQNAEFVFAQWSKKQKCDNP